MVILEVTEGKCDAWARQRHLRRLYDLCNINQPLKLLSCCLWLLGRDSQRRLIALIRTCGLSRAQQVCQSQYKQPEFQNSSVNLSKTLSVDF